MWIQYGQLLLHNRVLCIICTFIKLRLIVRLTIKLRKIPTLKLIIPHLRVALSERSSKSSLAQLELNSFNATLTKTKQTFHQSQHGYVRWQMETCFHKIPTSYCWVLPEFVEKYTCFYMLLLFFKNIYYIYFLKNSSSMQKHVYFLIN